MNSLDNRYERWIKPFYGVATKNLSQYLNWFVFLQKIKKSSEPIKEFANMIMTNSKTINQYRDIGKEYEKLNTPHYLRIQSKKITSIRKSKGITQSDMAKRIGLSQSEYLKVEIGRTKLEMQRFSTILIVFKMSGKDFFDDIDTFASYSNEL